MAGGLISGSGIQLGAAGTNVGIGFMAGNVGTPQYQSPSLDPTSQQTLGNLYGQGQQTPGQIAASQVNPALATGNQAASSIAGSAGRMNSALGMADPTNAVHAINARVMQNIKGQMGNMATNIQNEANFQAADQMTRALQAGLGNASMQNSISMQRLRSYTNQLVARSNVISTITGGTVQGIGAGAMMAKGKGGQQQAADAGAMDSGVGSGAYGAGGEFGGDYAAGATDLGAGAYGAGSGAAAAAGGGGAADLALF